jgi:SAM-dependent methyltransferase
VLCARCGLGRRDPLPGEKDLASYYSDGYRIELGKGRRPSKGRLWRISKLGCERALDLLKRVPPGSSSLDVGCGAGELVFMLHAAGLRARGFDPDSHYIQWAQSVMGSIVERRRIEEVDFEQSMDLVTLYHALEHMRDPQAVLDRCAGYLREGGLLVVEVPNFESTVQAPGHQYQKAHLHYFNQHTLTVMASYSNLQFEDGGAYDRGENLRCYFRKNSSKEHLEKASPENVERMLNILRRHRKLAHHGSVHPYRRVWKRLSRTVLERIHSAGRSDDSILKVHATELLRKLKIEIRRN